MAKILFVDDTEFFQKVFSDELRKAGFEVEVANDGEEALQKVRIFKPQLVFMDIVMPKLGGIEALVKIKADPELKNIPVIMLTGTSAAEKGEVALWRGASGYLVKTTIGPQDIIKKAQEILGKT